MFERFATEFAKGRAPAKRDPWKDDYLLRVPGYADFSKVWAGTTFEQGLYRVVDATTGPVLARLAAEAFPDFAARVHPFAYDWLGRAFALDASRITGGQPMVLMLEPGTGEALEIPHSFTRFHEELADLMEPALAASFFEAWAKTNAHALPLAPSVCVGYKVPLFLSGKDTVDNLEVADLDVYWTLSGQLHQGIRDLPTGTKIKGVSVQE
jgi:hypothetical protein